MAEVVGRGDGMLGMTKVAWPESRNDRNAGKPEQHPVVIPAKAGIQEGDVGMVNRLRPLSPASARQNELFIVIPAQAGM